MNGAGRSKIVAVMLALTVAVLLVVFAVYKSLMLSSASLKTITPSQLSGKGGIAGLAAPMVGKTLPAFTLTSLSGSSIVSSDNYMARAVIVNFFASWCTPCQQETPIFANVAKASKSAAQGSKVAFLGIDENDGTSAARNFITKSGVEYPVAFDPKSSLQSSFELYGLPTTLFVAPGGKIIGEYQGPVTKPLLLDWVARLSAMNSQVVG